MEKAVERLAGMQKYRENVRNICVLAHVDHGKTTLSDGLIAHNGFISQKLAGKLRFMDFLDDEQRRGITMKSAAISLLYTPKLPVGGGENAPEPLLINLIDSPGHVDFCSEVSTAARLSDGGLVVVDVVEGICVQTHAVLRQAFEERLAPCLVFNKLDRLIIEMGYTPQEAYERMRNLLYEINGVMSAFVSEKFISQADALLATSSEARDDDRDEPEVELEDAKIVGKKTAAGKLKPLFVQLVLDPIWKLYHAAEAEKHGYPPEGKGLNEMASSLKLDVEEKDLASTDRKHTLNAILKAWLPLSPTILEMVAHSLPSPVQSAPHRVFRLMPTPTLKEELTPAAAKELASAREALASCDTTPGCPTTAYISKMLAVPASAVHGMPPTSKETVFMGFGRVYSGTLKVGDVAYVINESYDPSAPEDGACQEIVIEELYLMMGRGMFKVDEVPAGNILAVGGLDKYVLKSATISSARMCAPMGMMMFQVAPIVKVAVEPESVADMPALLEGLRLLNRSDAFVEVGLMDTGEHVIAAAGEVHLERCVADLRERFAKVELKVSPPLVSFREGVSSIGVAEATTSNGLLTIRATTRPLPIFFPRVIEDSAESLKQILLSAHHNDVDADAVAALAPEIMKKLETSLEAVKVDDDGLDGVIPKAMSTAWALGPKQVGPNVLSIGKMLDGPGGGAVGAFGKPVVGGAFGFESTPSSATSSGSKCGLVNFSDPATVAAIEGNALTGFQMATERGPLCEEPLFGVNVVLEAFSKIDPDRGEDSDDGAGEDQYGPFSGQVIAATREAIRQSVLKASPRLVEAMYLSVITTTSEALGGTYSVLGKRRAKIISESIREGTGVFIIHSYLPVATSFGFADELRHSSSGASNAQLMLSHWEHLDVDPFFTPKTKEEREEFGEDGDAGPNIARKLVDATRRRKGLKVEEKVVKVATKQRTMSRKA
ncbi:uncharacterized protein MICPUCDRAFT_29848 [Micromonas pusilla CCMP1545]|uniref:Elongation factor-like 1 n=1 Tax=Micromonas pusilla (strain CCMP1545) TaxID=564608 RepID=C1N6S2_MICPC|nr:uncharacterized protein MICPUCDRAFT_29848 [Micromonas pusilla CCMP1545]EEH51975.1 predicted protein [Micromonas pusilla CCMP1545]|eukprot:XP_003063602.1 predicted protein [Micromonas pusilla CCMP1545]